MTADNKGKRRKYICFSISTEGKPEYRGIIFPDEDMFTHKHMWEAIKQLKTYEGPRWEKPLRRGHAEVIGAGFYDPVKHCCFGESYSLSVESNGEQDLNILFRDDEY